MSNVIQMSMPKTQANFYETQEDTHVDLTANIMRQIPLHMHHNLAAANQAQTLQRLAALAAP